MDKIDCWLDTLACMLPGVKSAVLHFSQSSNEDLEPHGKTDSFKNPDLTKNATVVSWPTSLPADEGLINFAHFSATNNSPISSMQEHGSLKICLPVDTHSKKGFCYLALNISLTLGENNQPLPHAKETAIRTTQWAAIWIGLLFSQLEASPTTVSFKDTQALKSNTLSDELPSGKDCESSSLDSSLCSSLIHSKNNKLALIKTTGKTAFEHCITKMKLHWKPLLFFTLLCLLMLLPVEYRISVQAQLKGKLESSIITPFDGFVQTVSVKPGDQVALGEVLATLDKSDILLKLSRLQAEHQEKQKLYRKMLATSKRGQAEIHKAQILQIGAKIKLAQQELSSTELKAIIAGTIIDGDLRDVLGAPVKKGDTLFKVAPTNQYRIVLEVTESDIRFIKQGQLAALMLASLPSDKLSIRLQKPSPIFSENAEQLTYRVEANFHDQQHSQLATGMKGIAKINVGKQSLGWSLFHHFIDWMRIQWWRFQP